MEKVTEKESLIKYLEENGLHIVKKSEFETLVNIAGEAYQVTLYVYISVEENMTQRI